MSVEAEVIIRDWIDSKCDPPPRSPGEIMRRVTGKIADAVSTLNKALQANWPEQLTGEGQEWELAK